MNPSLHSPVRRSRAPMFFLGWVIAAAMLSAVPVAASTVTEIDCDTESLQAAVDNAEPNDVLQIVNGYCSEGVTVDKDLTIRGRRPQHLDTGVGGSIAVAAGADVVLEDLNLGGNYGHRAVSTAGFVTLRNSEIYGGGLAVAGGEATLIDTVVQESVYEFKQGGGIHSCGTLNITGGWIGDNFADEGAGVYVACGEATITGTRFGGNGATHGGAIFVAGDADPTVTITDVALDYNQGYETGGAIHVAGGIVTVTGSTVTNNTASDGGGIYNAGGRIQLTDTVLQGNEANARVTTRTIREVTEKLAGPGPHLVENVHITTEEGPCIRITGAGGVTIRNAEIGPCGAEGILIGGWSSGVDIYDSFIHPESTKPPVGEEPNGSTPPTGIAIRVMRSSDIEVRGNVIAHGSSNLYAEAVSDLDVTNNLFVNPLGPYKDNKQIQVWAGLEDPKDPDSERIHSSRVDITDNVLINSADPFWGPSPDPGDAINLGYTTDADIAGNHIVGGHGFQACGIIADDATVEGARIRDNVLVGTAQCGIGIAGGSGIEVRDNSILNGHVNMPYPGGNVAMYAYNFYADDTHGCDAITIEGNTATAVFRDGSFRDFDNPPVGSSKICTDATGSPVTRESVATDNVVGRAAFDTLDPPYLASPIPDLPTDFAETLVDSPWTAGTDRPNGNGGAIYNSGGQVDIAGSDLVDNSADNSGGGIYNGWLGTVEADQTRVADNVAAAGGGVANRGGAVTLRRSRLTTDSATSLGITGNRATTSGGAVHNWYGFFAVRAVDMVDNTAQNGGAISNDAGGLVKVKRSTLQANAASASGGAVFTTGGTTIVRDTAIVENMALRGGGIHALLGTAELYDTSIAGNSASEKGGGFALGSINQSDGKGNLEVGPTVRIVDTDIDGNRGDGFHVSAGTSLLLRRSRVRDNTGSGIVAEDPGALVPFVQVEVRKSKIKRNGLHGVEVSGELLVKNTTIAGNHRSGLTLRGSATIRATTIANNHAAGWVGCGRSTTNVTFDSVTVKGNEPNGGLYVACGNVSIIDSYFARNRDALEGGAALYAAATTPLAADGATALLDPLDGHTTGEVFGTPRWEAAQPGRNGAIDLSAGDYVKYPIPPWDPAAEGEPPEGTIDLWVRPRHYGTTLAVVQWNDAPSPPASGYIGNLGIDDNGKLTWTSWTPGTGSDPGEPPIGASTIPLEQWSHVAVTWGAAGTTLYLDGEVDAQVTGNHYPAFSPFDPSFYVYVNGWGDTDLGAIDHFRISRIARSGAEIRTAAHATRVRVGDSTFWSNRAKGPAGRVTGGAILNHGTMSLDGVTINSNKASGKGGGIHNTGALEVANSTLSGNRTGRRGGGLAASSTGISPPPTTTLLHVSITDNTAAGTGGGLSATGGGLLDSFGSIMAGNDADGHPDVDVSGSVSMLSSYNVYGDCCDFMWSATDLTNVTDPKLGTLEDNGGTTKTHALLEGSPAIDLIPRRSCRLASDQRSVVRPQGRRCDAGSFELE